MDLPEPTPYVSPEPRVPVADSCLPVESPSTVDHSHCPTAAVFGSSLTKNLDVGRLSARGRRVHVSCHRGAHFHHIEEDMKAAISSGKVCPDCVTGIFLVVGGNNAQNATSFKKIQSLNSSFISLIDFSTHTFHNARINVFSTIPRKLVDCYHLGRIKHTNDFMFNITCQFANCRYIDISSHFLKFNRQYNEMFLNTKLYDREDRGDLIHLSTIGTSVLAKVIIGVLYRPWHTS